MPWLLKIFPNVVTMRKAIAIFFLVIILLNTAGYYLVFEGWKWHYSTAWSIDENSGAAEEVIIRVPLNVPYAQAKDWEKAEGQFEYQGDVYRITKQRVALDAVYIACVKDGETSRINHQLEDFAKTFSDKPVDGKQGVKTLPSMIKEYITSSISIKSISHGWFLQSTYGMSQEVLVPSYFASIVHPPEKA